MTFDVALFALGFALLRVWSQHGEQPIRYPDTPSYTELNFLGHGTHRLWTTPLLYTIVPNDNARVYVQMLIGMVCWTALAFAVARSLAHPIVARVGAVLVLLLGLCEQVTEWDTILLSESLALSLLALLVASLLWLRLRPTRWRLVGTLVVAVLWLFNRQLQATVFVLIAIVAIVWILLCRRRLIAVAVALAAIAAWGGYATAVSSDPIVRFNAHDILVLRILKSPEGADYFARRGMPRLAALEKKAAVATSSNKHVGIDAFLDDPEWTRWIDAHWRTAYAGWLLRHPVSTIKTPLRDASQTLSGFYDYGANTPALPGPIQDTLWDRAAEAGDTALFVALTLVLWLASLRARRRNHLDAFAAGMLAVTIVWYYAAWHLVATELGRIETPVAAALRIGLLILGLAAVDRLLTAPRPGGPLARADRRP